MVITVAFALVVAAAAPLPIGHHPGCCRGGRLCGRGCCCQLVVARLVHLQVLLEVALMVLVVVVGQQQVIVVADVFVVVAVA